MVGRTFWLAPVLDSDAAWIFLVQSGTNGSGAGLWARREWWLRWGDATPLPVLDLVGGDPRATCAATGVFPKP